ncbi:(deoxy)nucleoside triphosphate pyrophosphohydrolase [Aquiflexum lacus]|uniref:(deoxy)nucleoside triphosphate pyrophosphohydrolase n=1 Tax=Aquiflexum lacus TaxID=2483805 RepID=UPI00189617E2|nr:(deoxy)nucleoside triphosphate pyrophosphohydrolase [Aquiflexum lacus]
MVKLIKVTCAIILDSGRVLCTQRSENMDLPLKWEFPGGKMEENESAEECLKREIMEELNIEIEVLESFESNIHQYSPAKKIELIPLLCCFKSGNMVLKEHKTFCWKKVGSLSELDWAAADIPIVQNFLHWYSQKTPKANGTSV